MRVDLRHTGKTVMQIDPCRVRKAVMRIDLYCVYSVLPMLASTLAILSGCSTVTLPAADDSRNTLTPAIWKNEIADLADPAIDWSSFGDDVLAELIEQALSNNPDITTAVESLNASRLALDEARANRNLVYSVTGSAGADRIRDFSTTESYGISAVASYEVDVWGRQADNVTVAELGIVQAEASLLTTRISLAAEVADAYYSLRVQDERLNLQREALQFALRQQQQIQARHRAGIIAGIELNNQEVEIQRLRAGIEDLEGSRSLEEDRLAVLTGRPPQDFRLPGIASLALPAIRLAPETPAEVLRVRPDIRVAETRLRVSEVRFEQAKKAFYPTITLSGSTGLASDALNDLVTDSSWTWGIGADLVTTLFDNGARSRGVESARIGAAQSLAAYRGTILSALQDVEGALNQQEVNLRQFEIRQLQLAAQERLTRETEARYRVGAVSGFELVRQQRSLILQREQILNTRLAGIRATIRLFRAVGIAP